MVYASCEASSRPENLAKEKRMPTRAFPVVALVLGLAVLASAQQAPVSKPQKPYFPTEASECAAFSNEYQWFLNYLNQQRLACTSQLGLARKWVDAGSCCHEYPGVGGCSVEQQCWSQNRDWYCAAVEQIEAVEECYAKVQDYQSTEEILKELLSVGAVVSGRERFQEAGESGDPGQRRFRNGWNS